MIFRILADAVVLVHLAFVVFVVLGGAIVLRRPRVAWLHLPAAAWAAWVELAGRECPLTPLENWLRRHGGADTYATGFVEHYVEGILYPAFLTRELQWVLGGLVLSINAVMYGWLLLRWRRERSASARLR